MTSSILWKISSGRQDSFHVVHDASVRMIMLMLAINHWYACIWFILHRYVEKDKHNTWAIVDSLASYNATSGEHNTLDDEVNPFFAYVRAFTL